MREPPIEEIVGKIVTAFHPRRVMLFGSLARGDGNAESDADILVEMETDLKPFDRRLAVDRIFGSETGPWTCWYTRRRKSSVSRALSARCCTRS